MSQRFPVDGMSPITEKWGRGQFSKYMEMKAKVASMARKIEEMELRKVHEVQAISEPQQQANPCSICHHLNIWWKNVPPFQRRREMFGNKLT
ncbi:hypothetical protein AAG906_022690 [Vitis piasezkii]